MSFRLPTRIEMGPGSIQKLGDVCRQYPAGTVLVITDDELLKTPAPALVESLVQEAGYDVETLSHVVPNPRVDDVDAMADQARPMNPSLVVGIGGGSVLDAAKAVALMLRNPGSCGDYKGKNRFPEAAAPFVAIPTTCGTGSEVTWVSVLSDTGHRTKISVKGDGMFPAWALVDSDLLATLPAHLVASTAMDAITHAVEAFTGLASNPVSDELATAAVRLLLQNLERAVADIGGQPKAREAVMRASTLAGMAFGNADVGGVHCLSESIGGRHDLPHGLLNSVLLGPVMRYHGQYAAPRLADLASRLGIKAAGTDGSATALIARLEDLGSSVGIPSFDSLGVPENDFDAIARSAELNGSNGSNPRPMQAVDYRKILEGLA